MSNNKNRFSLNIPCRVVTTMSRMSLSVLFVLKTKVLFRKSLLKEDMKNLFMVLFIFETHQVKLCPENDVKLVRCVLGMTLKSFVVLQFMAVEL